MTTPNTVYIRVKPTWINFIKDESELTQLVDTMDIYRPIVVGDVSLFSRSLKNNLLKVVEEYNNISIYSSSDIADGILLSRFTRVVKEAPQVIQNGIEVELYEDSPRDYESVMSNLSTLDRELQLRATKLNSRSLQMLISFNDNSKGNKY